MSLLDLYFTSLSASQGVNKVELQLVCDGAATSRMRRRPTSPSASASGSRGGKKLRPSLESLPENKDHGPPCRPFRKVSNDNLVGCLLMARRNKKNASNKRSPGKTTEIMNELFDELAPQFSSSRKSRETLHWRPSSSSRTNEKAEYCLESPRRLKTVRDFLEEADEILKDTRGIIPPLDNSQKQLVRPTFLEQQYN